MQWNLCGCSCKTDKISKVDFSGENVMNYLFMTDAYYPKASANGICVKKIVINLRNRGHRVFTISWDEDSEIRESSDDYTIKTYYVLRMPSVHLNSNIKKKIIPLCGAISHNLSPVSYWSYVCQYLRMAETIIKENNIDCVICAQFPFEAVYAGYLLKKRYPYLRFMTYELDFFSEASEGKLPLFVYRIRKKIYRAWYRKIYELTECVLYMEPHKLSYESENYYGFKEKFIGIFPPLLLNLESRIDRAERFDYQKAMQSHSNIKMLYSGVLLANVRPPFSCCRILAICNNSMPLHCDFFSRGECEDFLEEQARLYPGVFHPNGYVSQEELDEHMRNTDVLLSIGNAVSEMLPSKIFSYMTYQKPIIHFSQQEKDMAGDILKHYSYALVISNSMPDHEAAKCIAEFLQKFHTKEMLDYKILLKDFEMCTPDYTANIVEMHK